MPFSQNVFDKDFLDWFLELKPKPKRVLDLGCGAGKYGRIIKNQVDENIYLVGYEKEPTYISRFPLQESYNEISQVDIATIPDWDRFGFYDVCILGDVIEHLRKSDGIDLINFLLYRCRWIWIVYPTAAIQVVADQPTETHRSIWQAKDFPIGGYVVKHLARNGKELIILRGLLSLETANIPAITKQIIQKSIQLK